MIKLPLPIFISNKMIYHMFNQGSFIILLFLTSCYFQFIQTFWYSWLGFSNFKEKMMLENNISWAYIICQKTLIENNNTKIIINKRLHRLISHRIDFNIWTSSFWSIDLIFLCLVPNDGYIELTQNQYTNCIYIDLERGT